MSNRNPDSSERSLDGMLRFSMRQTIKELFISIPGLVQGYDAATRRCRVQPAVDVMLTDGSTLEQPVLDDIPVLFPGGGGFVCHFPLAEGDAVMLLFSQRGIDGFKLDYGRHDPERDVICSVKDAVAIPCFGAREPTLPAAAAGGIVLSAEDGSSYLSVGPAGVEIQTPGPVSINASGVTHNGTNIGRTHTHGGVFPGGSNTGGPS